MTRDHEPRDEPIPDPDVVPEGAPRGAKTVPDANDSGLTTPPISGWGETVSGEEQESEDRERSADPRGR
jgi:hypothetical protein